MGETLSSIQQSRPDLGPVKWVGTGSFTGVKRRGWYVDHLHSATVKIEHRHNYKFMYFPTSKKWLKNINVTYVLQAKIHASTLHLLSMQLAISINFFDVNRNAMQSTVCGRYLAKNIKCWVSACRKKYNPISCEDTKMKHAGCRIDRHDISIIPLCCAFLMFSESQQISPPVLTYSKAT